MIWVRLSVLLLAVAPLGCGAGWHQPASVAPGALPARQQVQVWQEGRMVRWHAVQITADSLLGIPFTQPTSCDSCRVGVARTAVDSIRLGNPVGGLWKTVGLIGGIVLAYGVIYCLGGCGND